VRGKKRRNDSKEKREGNFFLGPAKTKCLWGGGRTTQAKRLTCTTLEKGRGRAGKRRKRGGGGKATLAAKALESDLVTDWKRERGRAVRGGVEGRKKCRLDSPILSVQGGKRA